MRPHQNDWKEAKAFLDGWYLTNSMISVSVNDPSTSKTLLVEKSFCEVSGENVVVTVLKKLRRGTM